MSDDRHGALDMIRDLTQPITNREHIQTPIHNNDGTITWHTRDHITINPCLVTQLQNAVEQSGSVEEGFKSEFKSKPNARIDAIDAYIRIDLEAARWVRDLGEDDPGSTIACITKLAGLAASANCCDRKPKPGCCTVHEIEQSVRGWWSTARVLSGWDTPAWKPRNTCPLCGQRGSLQIRLDRHVGYCTNCQESWSPEQIGLLADHIRAENREDGEPDDEPEGDAA